MLCPPSERSTLRSVQGVAIEYNLIEGYHTSVTDRHKGASGLNPGLRLKA